MIAMLWLGKCNVHDTVLISIAKQRVYYFGATGKLVFVAPCSTGRHNATPRGDFAVRATCKRAWSTKYKCYMPYCITLIAIKPKIPIRPGAVALHGLPYQKHQPQDNYYPKYLGRYPSSHGCIRMAVGDAKKLKVLVKPGNKVLIR